MTSPAGDAPQAGKDADHQLAGTGAARARLAAQVPPPEVASLKDKLDAINRDKEEAVRDQNFETAAALRDQERELFRRALERPGCRFVTDAQSALHGIARPQSA